MKFEHVYIYIIISVTLCYSQADEEVPTKDVASVRVVSCRGCYLNRLPEVKAFINEDLPLYDNVEFIHKTGEKPVLIPLDKSGQELARIQLSSKDRGECNEVLEKMGFQKRGSDDDVDQDDLEASEDRDEL